MDTEGLSIICAGLGIAEEDDDGRRIGYTKGEYCLDNLKDLLRFLRRDDPQTREVFKQVCRWNIVSKDLIPIMEHYQDDRNLVLNAVKVLVFLTMPIEPSSNDIPQQIEYLWGLKSSITCSNVVGVIVSLVEGPLENLECEAFTEDDWKLVQLVLTLFRNILAIQDMSLLQKAGGSATHFLSLRDRFLELLFHENVMDLIIVITQHVGGSSGYLHQDNLLLLETFYYIFSGQEPELIAKAHLKDSKMGADTKASLDNLKSIMKEEEEKRKLARLRNMSRHSQFSGTFTRLTMDGSKAVFKGNPSSVSQNLVKVPKGHSATKKTVWEHGRLLPTKDNILELLHDFINQFLAGGYNVLMQSIREDIEKEHHAIQNSDIIVFFQVAQFVTSFQYHKFLNSKPTMEAEKSEASSIKEDDMTFFKGDICGPIAASMNESMFLLVISRWRYAFDGLKETNDYKFLSAAGSLMKNMIQMLELVLRLLPEDSKEPQTARILLYKLFYDQTDQGMTHFLLNLIKSFDTHKQPKSDLSDLVEVMYAIVCQMENLQARGTLRVSKKSRKGRKKKSQRNRKETEKEQSEDHHTILNETGIPSSEQTADFSFSRKDGPLNVISNGNNDVSGPVLARGPGISESEMENLRGDGQHMDNKKSNHVDDDLLSSTGDSSGDEQPLATDEVDCKVSTLISAFANWGVIQNLCWLLKFYKSNSKRTNHYVICMLQKITDELELSPMLYQLSLLTTFHNVLDEQKSSPCKDYANIVDFLTSLVRKMLKKMKNQPLLFIEILFWKTRKECHYIDCEYLLNELGHVKKEIGNQAYVSANGEIGLLQNKGWTHRSIADALGEDEADVVISHGLRLEKNGGSIGEVQEGITSISNSGIDQKENSNYEERYVEHESEKVPQRKRRLLLTDDLETKIKDLYGKFKDDRNCSRLIAELLDPNCKVSAAQVSNKLKQLGLTVVPRKRMRYTGGSGSAGPDQHGEEGQIIENESTLCHLNDFEGRSARKPLDTRKRVSAFSKDQEAMIKDLFEQFKDHRRCSYLIANALDADNTFTAAQVSRKLRQLGLHAHKKRAQANMLLRDEEHHDLHADGAHGSDSETLIAFRKRSKSKDDQKLSNDEVPEQNVEGNMSEDSDDETLSSVLKRTRKLPSGLKDEKLTTGPREGTVNELSGAGVIKDDPERDTCFQSRRIGLGEIDEDVAFHPVSQEGTSESEMGSIIKRNLPVVSPVNRSDGLPHQQEDDELADSGDDMDPDASITNAVFRRKLRMVIDPEDDD